MFTQFFQPKLLEFKVINQEVLEQSEAGARQRYCLQLYIHTFQLVASLRVEICLRASRSSSVSFFGSNSFSSITGESFFFAHSGAFFAAALSITGESFLDHYLLQSADSPDALE